MISEPPTHGDTDRALPDQQEELTRLYNELFGDQAAAQLPAVRHSRGGDQRMTDAEIIGRARASQSLFTSLFDHGDTSRYGGDESRADLALCALLAFWTQDATQIDRIFRQSALCRDKWEKRQDYRDRTIAKALSHQSATYSLPLRLRLHSTGAAAPGASEGLPAQRAWPSPPGRAAYCGLLGEIVDTVLPYTEADPINIAAHILAGFGCAVGPGPYLQLGVTRHAPRVFTLIVGKTSRARKTEGAQPARTLLALADPEFGPRIQSGLQSGEALIHAVRDPVIKNGTQVDDGVQDKRLWLLDPEFSRNFAAQSRQGSIQNAVTRESWDSGILQTLSKTSPARATGAHVVMSGHITEEELKALLTGTDMANGFANRFIMFCVKRSKLLPIPEPIPGTEIDRLAAKLGDALIEARQIGRMSIDHQAKAQWEAEYGVISRDIGGLAGSILARAETQVLRLAMVYALLDGSQWISLSHLESALALWDYAEQSVRYLFGELTGNPVADVILKALLRGGRMSRTDISNQLGRNTSAAAIQAALDLLAATGKAVMSEEAHGETGGRPTEYWTATRPGD